MLIKKRVSAEVRQVCIFWTRSQCLVIEFECLPTIPSMAICDALSASRSIPPNETVRIEMGRMLLSKVWEEISAVNTMKLLSAAGTETTSRWGCYRPPRPQRGCRDSCPLQMVR